jgi:phospholipid/cholesterol/gamma-HCH transport system substrate-binding protein
VTTFRERRPWVVGLVSIILLGIGVGFAFSINRFEALKGVYSISADLRDAANLQSGNEVRVAGVKVGQVTDVSLLDHAARVHLEIQNDVRLPIETRVKVKLKTLLGQKFVDLQLPSSFVAAGSNENDPTSATDGFLEGGDVIPLSQTEIPYEIHQAATEGTQVLRGIDKAGLRRLIAVFTDTIATSKQELRRAFVDLEAAGKVLSTKSGDISLLLKNARRATRALAVSDSDLEGILSRSAEVLTTLADRRETVSSLLAATNELAADLGLLIRVVRGSVDVGAADLNGILLLLEGELGTIDAALAELGTAQEMFGRPLSFGRFTEGHVCSVTSADTCVPFGSPEDPGLPSHGVQPSPASQGGLR